MAELEKLIKLADQWKIWIASITALLTTLLLLRTEFLKIELDAWSGPQLIFIAFAVGIPTAFIFWSRD